MLCGGARPASGQQGSDLEPGDDPLPACRQLQQEQAEAQKQLAEVEQRLQREQQQRKALQQTCTHLEEQVAQVRLGVAGGAGSMGLGPSPGPACPHPQPLPWKCRHLVLQPAEPVTRTGRGLG